MNKSLFTSKYQCWETPKDLFNLLNHEFHFTIDACASENNKLCDRYFSEKDNFLEYFISDEVIFCNPPYNRIYDFVDHCALLSKFNNTIVMLIPSRTDTKWFHNFIYNKDNVEIRFLKGRLKFTINGIRQNSAPFPSMVVIFRKCGVNNG